MTLGGDGGQGTATQDTERETERLAQSAAESRIKGRVVTEIRRGSGYKHEAGMRGGENSDLRNHLCRGREPHAFSGKISTITTEHCRSPPCSSTMCRQSIPSFQRTQLRKLDPELLSLQNSGQTNLYLYELPILRESVIALENELRLSL